MFVICFEFSVYVKPPIDYESIFYAISLVQGCFLVLPIPVDSLKSHNLYRFHYLLNSQRNSNIIMFVNIHFEVGYMQCMSNIVNIDNFCMHHQIYLCVDLLSFYPYQFALQKSYLCRVVEPIHVPDIVHACMCILNFCLYQLTQQK